MAIDEEIVRRIADPNDDLGHAEIVDDLLMEYARMQDVIFKTYGTKPQAEGKPPILILIVILSDEHGRI